MKVNGELVQQIITEVGASQAHWLIWLSVKWAVLGGMLGLVAAILGILLFRKVGWYRSGWRFEAWVRWPLWGGSVVCVTAFAGAAGFCKGLVQGSEQVLRHSQLATKVFPPVGDALADVVGGFQLYASVSNPPSVTDSNFMARVADFQAGGWEVNVPQLNRQLDELPAGVASNLVSKIESNIVARTPMLQSGLPNTLLHHVLGYGWKFAVARKVEGELRDHKLDTCYQTARARLLSAAQQAGDPATISRGELSAFLVQEAVVPSVMVPVRIFLIQNVALFGMLGGLSLVLPAVLFRLTCGWVRARPREVPVGPVDS